MVDKQARVRRPHNTIADALGAAILAGELPPGHILDGEAEASARRNVSRGSYREAIRTLAAKGLVTSRPKAGTRVLERSRWNLLDLDVLRWLFSREPDERVLRDLFQLRSIVEPAAAGLAALAWQPDTIAPLRAAMDAMVTLPNTHDDWSAADKEFHDVIFQLGGNSFVVALSSAISTGVRLSTAYKLRGPGPVRNSTIDHLRVYEAIVARDEALASIRMGELIDMALEETLRERLRALAHRRGEAARKATRSCSQ